MLTGQARKRAFRPLISTCFGFDDYLEGAGIVAEIALVYAEKENSVTLGHEITAAAHENEIVVVVADDRDQSPGRLSAHQLFAILNIGKAVGRRHAIIAETDAASGTYAQPLAATDHQSTVGPTITRII